MSILVNMKVQSHIREARSIDKNDIWEIFQLIIQSNDTYAIPADSCFADFETLWMEASERTYVAEMNHQITGTYIIKPNHMGRGNHIANASYMVHPLHQGKGVGNQMCQHSIAMAKKMGYRGMQFNIVVSTNEPAIQLWKKHGFSIIGSTPEGFLHPVYGFVDTLIMYRSLLD
jgi:L-amino acid N-acyltransferase YncA